MDEFKFPDELSAEKKDAPEVDFSVEGETEVEIVDDTPPEDRGRTPMKEPPPEVTDEELEQYKRDIERQKRFESK